MEGWRPRNPAGCAPHSARRVHALACSAGRAGCGARAAKRGEGSVSFIVWHGTVVPAWQASRPSRPESAFIVGDASMASCSRTLAYAPQGDSRWVFHIGSALMMRGR
eukprot:350545-Chlamydomonas_euryale.AAC.6